MGERKEVWMKGRINERRNERKDEWKGGLMKEGMKGRMNERKMNTWMNELIGNFCISGIMSTMPNIH